MEIKVGNYVLNGELKSRKEAKEAFLNHYPLVTVARLDKELNRIFKDDNKSNNITEPSAKGNSSSAISDKRAVGKGTSGKD